MSNDSDDDNYTIHDYLLELSQTEESVTLYIAVKPDSDQYTKYRNVKVLELSPMMYFCRLLINGEEVDKRVADIRIDKPVKE